MKNFSLFAVSCLIDERESAEIPGEAGPTRDHHVGVGAGVFDPGSGLLQLHGAVSGSGYRPRCGGSEEFDRWTSQAVWPGSFTHAGLASLDGFAREGVDSIPQTGGFFVLLARHGSIEFFDQTSSECLKIDDRRGAVWNATRMVGCTVL